VQEAALREADPQLVTFINVNTPEQLDSVQCLAAGKSR
jgi:hypothetical protein